MKILLFLPLLLSISVPAIAHKKANGGQTAAQHNNHSIEVEEGRRCPTGFKTVDGMECVQICPPPPPQVSTRY